MKHAPIIIAAVAALLICAAGCRSSKEVAAHQQHTEQIQLRSFDSLTIYIAQDLVPAFHSQAAGLEISSPSSPPALVPIAAAARRTALDEKTAIADSSVKKTHWEAPHLAVDTSIWQTLGYIAAILVLLTIVLLSFRH